MKFLVLLALSLFFALLLGNVLAEDASVTFVSPAAGATLDVMAQNKIQYTVEPGPRGDHVHLYINGEETAVLRQLKGSYTLDSLPPGPHQLCIKVVNKNHTPIGVESCIDVTVQ